MATISENLQIIKDSTDAIKQAIIDKGGDASGDISTWANVISGLSGGGSEEYVFTGTLSYNGTIVTVNGNLDKFPDTGRNYLVALGRHTGGICYDSYYISSTGFYTLNVDYVEPVRAEIPAICILNILGDIHTVVPVTFNQQSGGSPN